MEIKSVDAFNFDGPLEGKTVRLKDCFRDEIGFVSSGIRPEVRYTVTNDLRGKLSPYYEGAQEVDTRKPELEGHETINASFFEVVLD